MKELPLPTQLKEARSLAGLTQEALGILAGIDEFSASARMNQYEKGVHVPSFKLLERCGKILNVPVEFFYARCEQTATLLLAFHRLPKKSKDQVIEYIQHIEVSPKNETPK